MAFTQRWVRPTWKFSNGLNISLAQRSFCSNTRIKHHGQEKPFEHLKKKVNTLRMSILTWNIAKGLSASILDASNMFANCSFAMHEWACPCYFEGSNTLQDISSRYIATFLLHEVKKLRIFIYSALAKNYIVCMIRQRCLARWRCNVAKSNQLQLCAKSVELWFCIKLQLATTL